MPPKKCLAQNRLAQNDLDRNAVISESSLHAIGPIRRDIETPPNRVVCHDLPYVIEIGLQDMVGKPLRNGSSLWRQINDVGAFWSYIKHSRALIVPITFHCPVAWLPAIAYPISIAGSNTTRGAGHKA
jgi:hypothetical protein